MINAKLWNLDVALIYTTHATLLGRHLAAGGSDLYNNIDRFNLDEEAGKRKVIFSMLCIPNKFNTDIISQSIHFDPKIYQAKFSLKFI